MGFIVWGDYDRRFDSTYVRVHFVPGGVDLGEDDLLEFYDDSGRLEIPGTRIEVRPEADAVCSTEAVEFDLSSLPDGEYTMVHRRSSMPAGYSLSYADPPWTTFEGEEALVTTIVRQYPIFGDGGPVVADGGL